MATEKADFNEDNRYLIGIIADEVTITGFLFAGIGEVIHTDNNEMFNFLIVHDDDYVQDIEKFFRKLYNQPNIGIILIGSDIWEYLKPFYNKYNQKQLPLVIDIMTKTSTTKPLRLIEIEMGPSKQAAQTE